MGLGERIGANRLVLGLSAGRWGDAVGNSILFIVLPIYVKKLASPEFPWSNELRVAVLIAIYGLLNAATEPFMGAVSDRLRRRKLLIEIGLIIMIGATASFVFARSYMDLIIMRLAQAIGVALAVPATVALLAAGTKHETRGGSMGIFTTTRMFGLGIGPIIGGYLQSHYSIDIALYAGAGFVTLGLVLVYFLVNDVPPDTERPFKLFDASLFSMGIVGASFATFCMGAAFAIMLALENEFNRRLHETAFGFSLAFSALIITRLIFQLPFGWLSDKIGRRPLIVSGLIVMTPSTVMLGYASTTTDLAIWRAIQGLGAAGVVSPAFAVVADLAKGGGEGRQMSIVTMGFLGGIGVGPLIGGFLAPVFFALPFIVGGALLVIGAWVVLQFVPETAGPRAEEADSSTG